MVLKIVRNTTKNDPEDRDKESNMPQGKGTYGKKVGRPKKKRKGLVAKIKQRRSVTGKKKRGIQSVTKTKGGNYPTYKKKSKAAKSYRAAHAAAKPGTVYTWNGRKYKKAATKKKKPTTLRGKAKAYGKKVVSKVKSRVKKTASNVKAQMKKNRAAVAARRKKK
tara:strand:+ start:204 stop:695 length:492 start_codon:yes stop_codon:yes gene_type:complete